MPWLLERALVCEKINWAVLPEDLDERSVTLKHALTLLRVFRAHQHKAQDMDTLNKDEAELIDYVDGLRNKHDDQ